MTVAVQIILFFALAAEGALTRLAYRLLEKARAKIKSRALSIATDVLTALAGAGVMFLTCFLLAGFTPCSSSAERSSCTFCSPQKDAKKHKKRARLLTWRQECVKLYA